MAITQLLQFGCLCEQLLPESEQRHHLIELEADDFIPHCQQPIVLSTLLVHRVETTIRVLLRTVHVECDPRFPAGSGPSCSRRLPSPSAESSREGPFSRKSSRVSCFLPSNTVTCCTHSCSPGWWRSSEVRLSA